MRLSMLLTDLRKDVVYAMRALLKSPGFALVGILSLGMGIGVPTVVFSELNAIIFRDIPGAKDATRLALVEAPVSYPYFERFREQRDMFADAAAFQQSVPFNVAIDAKEANKQRIFGHIVSPEYFRVLGTIPARGRLFSPEIDKPGSPGEVVVSDRFWRNRLNADPNTVGRTLQINGRTATIVGIGPPDFMGVMPFLPADLFVPTTAPAALAPELADDVLHRRDRRAFRVVLRLNQGVTLQSAEGALDSLTRHLDQETLDPDRNRKGRRVSLLPGGSVFPLPREAMPILYSFYGTLLGLILTIACMNLTNMMLARAATRRREVAIRLAIGASRFRLVRQLLTESVLLATCGGIAGLLLTIWLSHAAANLKLPVDIPYQIDISPDWRVLVFTLVVSVVTGLLFGLAPALETVKTNLVTSLKEGGVVVELRGYRRFGLRNLLMVWQVAASLMVLMISGFIILGIQKTSAVTKGVDVQHLYVFSLDPVRDGYSPEQTSSFFEKLVERLRGVGAVNNVALADRVPFAPDQSVLTIKTDALSGGDASRPQALERIGTQAVGAAYFAALGVSVRSGREFVDHDERTSSANRAVLPAILNEPAARALFGGVSAIAQHISEGDQSYEVVGVVPELRSGFSMNGELPVMYVPLTRSTFAHPPAGGITVLIRAFAGSDAVDGVRREIAAIDPNLSVFGMQPLQRQLDQMDAYMRVGAGIYGSLGVFGLVLSSIGLAGVTAYSVARRRKEIGIRVALGSRAGQVLRLVLREAGALILAGTTIGFAGAFAISRALSSLTAAMGTVFAPSTSDPTLLVGAPLLLTAVTLLACYLPARKSTRIDPLAALRQE